MFAGPIISPKLPSTPDLATRRRRLPSSLYGVRPVHFCYFGILSDVSTTFSLAIVGRKPNYFVEVKKAKKPCQADNTAICFDS